MPFATQEFVQVATQAGPPYVASATIPGVPSREQQHNLLHQSLQSTRNQSHNHDVGAAEGRYQKERANVRSARDPCVQLVTQKKTDGAYRVENLTYLRKCDSSRAGSVPSHTSDGIANVGTAEDHSAQIANHIRHTSA